ncbi:MAG: apolipoprotein N-acyltransferase [Prevotellaceae bacterium]|jgi:apolipoprotein N-acyltransferase|nr:apolipoprotein N-acyltransferase [Prevotellaceae bacterium]
MKRHLILTLLSALLLSLPWFESFSGLLLLIAFVPLLLVEQQHTQVNKRGLWRYVALCFFVWNAATTWWIMHATVGGMLFAITANTAQMTFVFMLARWVKKKTSPPVGYTALVAFWVTWEYFYLNAEISWPWLTLGNGLAKDIALIQWYELVGTLGGSLWILLINVLLFNLLQKYSLQRKGEVQRQKSSGKWVFLFSPTAQLCLIALLIATPITYSLIRYYTYKEQGSPCHVAILQPNIDPYTEKFNKRNYHQQRNIILALADSSLTVETDYVIAPETAFEGSMWENTLAQHHIVLRLRKFCEQRPRVKFITGATTLYQYEENEKLSPTARQFQDAPYFYDIYNSALQIDTSPVVETYHKSKLVVGVEMLPYPKYLKLLNTLAINLGGTAGGLGTQPERSIFGNDSSKFKPGVAICYESIFGEYYAEYVQKGANLMFIITNDGWWRNTPGYRQHLHYASLRAIETRRSIARSANTGISAIINQRGQIEQHTDWWVRAAISGTINTNSHSTPYVRTGDAAARIASMLSILIGLYTLSITFRKKNG